LAEIAEKSDPDARLVDVRLALMTENRDWWAHEAVTNGDALGHLSGKLATAEGLEEGSGEWVTRTMELEKEARSA
jgi:hypothetical protein